MPRSRMIVVAGPSGSGKTTCFPLSAFGDDFFNVDDRCAEIVGSYWGAPRAVRDAAASACERFVQEHIEQGRSFCLETTLRPTAALRQAELARARGFATHLRFVATDAVEVNVRRVLQRAQAGGHSAPEDQIRTIYEASLANLRTALRTFERIRIYDSTSLWAVPRLVATVRDEHVTLVDTSPAWLLRALGRPESAPVPVGFWTK